MYIFKLNTHYVLLICLLVSKSNISYSLQKDLAPLTLTGTTKVTAEDVLELAIKIPSLLIIDARIRLDRQHGYIEGSKSLPDVETNCASLANIIPAKHTAVVFYCNGEKCGRSFNSSKIAIECGYKTIYWFRGGYEEWKAKNYPLVK